MKKHHKVFANIVFFSTAISFYFLNASLTEVVTQNFVTFFSVVFGFYITATAILYNSSFIKKLHQEVDEKEQKTNLYILQFYLKRSGRWLIFSIGTFILFSIFAKKEDSGSLYFEYFKNWNVSFGGYVLDFNLSLNSVVLGIAAVNIYFMLLVFHTLINSMTEEARNCS